MLVKWKFDLTTARYVCFIIRDKVPSLYLDHTPTSQQGGHSQCFCFNFHITLLCPDILMSVNLLTQSLTRAWNQSHFRVNAATWRWREADSCPPESDSTDWTTLFTKEGNEGWGDPPISLDISSPLRTPSSVEENVIRLRAVLWWSSSGDEEEE